MSNELNFTNCQKLADKNDPDGLYRLGYCYEYGIGIEKDENKAFKHYQKSAEMNNSNGLYQVGYCYYLGIGVGIDKHKAFTYYLKSAEVGNSMGIWKTVVCYLHGIGVEKNEDKYQEWIKKDPIRIDGFRRIRYSKYGICGHCNEDNTKPAWCLSCDSDIATRWTIGNMVIDDCIKTFQLRTSTYEDVIEWIPFNRLSDINEIGKGGFGKVYTALWLDGIRKVDGNDYNYERARKPSSIVALKTLIGSKENNFDFLKEFKSLMTCKLQLYSTKLAIYGITQNTETDEYLMVFQYANNGNLYKYLRKNFREITWLTKLQILKDISTELKNIHIYAEYIHGDFHSGNILQDQQSYIADLGLSRKKDECISEDEIYGVMPYVAPEVLSGEQKFTQAADVYGFGIIMAEISSGQRPFDGRKFNAKLGADICRGLRPEFAPGTPKCYIKLAESCMNADPQERPSAFSVFDVITNWFFSDEIKKQFLDADNELDKIIKILPISRHPDEMYTSKIISTKLISKAIKDLSQPDSAQINLDVSEFESFD